MRYKIELFLRGDYTLHFLMMFFIQSVVMVVLKYFNIELGFLSLSVFPIMIGFLKELFDTYEGKNFDHLDWLSTIIGGLTAILIV